MGEHAPSRNYKKMAIAALALLGVVGVVVVLASTGTAAPVSMFQDMRDAEDFDGWMFQHEKSYNHDEYAMRFRIWQENNAAIKLHNRGRPSYSLMMNSFGDLTADEFAATYLSKFETDRPKDIHVFDTTAALPTTVDWTTKGAVTAVKNQGQCGSCWSFSTTGSVEGVHFLSGNALVSLSEAQLMDCSTSFGNKGCDGGLMDDAFKYIVSAGGLEAESEYPYTGADGTCEFNKSDVVATISGYKDVTPNNMEQLMAAVAQQPVSIAVEANQLSWQFYFGGVIDFDCGTALDHGVLLVGYGTDKGKDMWKVKNSWGASWGNEGYLYIERSSANYCGVECSASYPTTETYPAQA